MRDKNKYKRSIEKFKEEWFKRAEELKTNPLHPDEAWKIKRRYGIHRNKFMIFIPSFVRDGEMNDMLLSTESEVQTALSIAVSKYKETEKAVRKSKMDVFKEVIKKIKLPF